MGFRKWLRRIWIAAGVAATFAIWFGFQAANLPEGIGTELQFEGSGQRAVRVLFFPGAMVEPRAYSPLAKRLADAGYSAIVQPLPWRMGFTDSMRRSLFEKASAMTREGRWVISGHSRGAALAAQFAHQYPERVQGLILVGTTHPRELDLSGVRYPVTKILGTEDGIASVNAARAFGNLLPREAVWETIDGANHVHFGFYRYQLGDGAARISRERQQSLLLSAMLRALERSERYVETGVP